MHNCYEKGMSESHWGGSDISRNRGNCISFASTLRRAISILHNGHQFRVSALIFMKIKSGEWKYVYIKEGKRELKTTVSAASESTDPDRRLFTACAETRSTVFGPPSGIASAKLDPHRQTADGRFHRFSDGQEVNIRKPLSLN